MKRFIQFFVLTLSLTACAPEPQAPLFDLYLSYAEHEYSEDSNSSYSELRVIGYDLEYSWRYEGYHPNPEFVEPYDLELRLSEEEFAELALLLEGSGFYRDVEEVHELNGDNTIVVDLEVDLIHEDRLGSASIKGEMDEIENESYLLASHELLHYVMELLEE